MNSAVNVLMYHSISDSPGPTSIDPATFRGQMEEPEASNDWYHPNQTLGVGELFGQTVPYQYEESYGGSFHQCTWHGATGLKASVIGMLRFMKYFWLSYNTDYWGGSTSIKGAGYRIDSQRPRNSHFGAHAGDYVSTAAQGVQIKPNRCLEYRDVRDPNYGRDPVTNQWKVPLKKCEVGQALDVYVNFTDGKPDPELRHLIGTIACESDEVPSTPC